MSMNDPFAHLRKSERFTPPDRLECREMTVIDEKTGDEVLMLRRGFGEMAVWKPIEEWRAEDKAMWQKFYKEHPVQTEKIVGTYLGDWDGCGDPPGTSYVQTPPEPHAFSKRGRFEGWNVEPVDVPLSFAQKAFTFLFIALCFGMLFLAMLLPFIKGAR